MADRAGLRRLTEQPKSRPNLLSAEVLELVGDVLRVRVPSFADDIVYEVQDFTGIVAAGDRVLLGFDERGDEWVVVGGIDLALAAIAEALAGKQPLNVDLSAIAALVSAANKLPYATAAGAWSLADLTAAGRALLDDADAAAQLTTLGFSDFIKTLRDDADAAAARTTLGAVSAEAAWTAFTPTFSNFTLGNGTHVSRYIKIGKLLFVRVRVTLGSTSSFSGGLYLNHPISVNNVMGGVPEHDGATTTYDSSSGAQCYGAALVGGSVECHWGITYTPINGTNPMTWGTGDQFNISYSCEAA